MRVSVFYDHIREASRQKEKPEEEILRELYQAGVRGLEIRLWDLLEDQDLYEKISREGFLISCIYEFYQMEKLDETEKMKEHINTAARTGCGRILAVPGFLDRNVAEEFHRLADTGDKKALYSYMNEEQGIQSMCQGLARLSDYRKKKEIKVTVEDFDDYTSPLSRTYGISWFLEQVPDLGFTFDMGNFAYMQEDIWEAWEKLSPYITHVHCKDRCRGLEPAPAGTGDIPMKALAEKLKEIGYEGWLAAEHFGAPDQEAFMLGSAGFLIKTIRE